MLEILLVVIIGAAIIYALKDLILGLIGIAAIVAAVVFLGPPILTFILQLLALVLPFLPYLIGGILVLVGGILVLALVGYISNRIKYGSRIAELNSLGIVDQSYFSKDTNALQQMGKAQATADGYIISSKFYSNLTWRIGQTHILSQDGISDYCCRCASNFQANYLSPLLTYLCEKEVLFLFPLRNNAYCYLSRTFVEKCEDLFDKEGAATHQELVHIFELSPVTTALRQESNNLVAFILEYLLSSGKAEKIWLSDSGEDLYVSKNSKSDSKLVRHEISLD